MAKIQKDQTIYDARTLGSGKMMILGLQHLFAMFGATILVPVITGLSVSATLLFAGIGTLIFHLCTKMMVPSLGHPSLFSAAMQLSPKWVWPRD